MTEYEKAVRSAKAIARQTQDDVAILTATSSQGEDIFSARRKSGLEQLLQTPTSDNGWRIHSWYRHLTGEVENVYAVALRVAYYADRGDPEPPNNYRAELMIDGVRLTAQVDGEGCTTRQRAFAIALKWSRALNLPLPTKVS